MDTIDSFTHKGHTVEIAYDEFRDENPFDECNLGTFVAFHKRYKLGTTQDAYKNENYNSWSELEKDIIKNENPVVILPVFMYDHSGLSFKIGSFQGMLPQGHAEFDSGQVGYIFVSREKAVKEYGCKRFSKKQVEIITNVLKGELEEYTAWVNGQIYGYHIEDDAGECIDSCGGYTDMNTLREDAISVIDNRIAKVS